MSASKLVKAIEALIIDAQITPSPELIADALWLAAQITSSLTTIHKESTDPVGKRVVPPSPPPATVNSQAHPPEPTPDTPAADQIETPKVSTSSVYLPSHGSESCSAPERYDAVRLADAEGLPYKLEIGRALRLLKHHVPTRRKGAIDEKKTAHRMAESLLADARVPIIVRRPEVERWLRLELIIERSDSMVLWDRATKELRDMLEWHGAFRDVRVWDLDTRDTTIKLKRPDSDDDVGHHKIMDIGQRSLVMVVSDCISEAWDNGDLEAWMRDWGRYMPVVALQMLPKKLWRGTGLGPQKTVRSLTPGTPNARLQTIHARRKVSYAEFIPTQPYRTPFDRPVLLPVVPIADIDTLHKWGRLLLGQGRMSARRLLRRRSPSPQSDTSPSSCDGTR